MKIAVSDPGRGYRAYREEIDGAVAEVLQSGHYILGPAVRRFEADFGAWTEARGGAVTVANGTDALHLALRTLGVGPGHLVFTVSHTAVATVAAIELAGATPVLVDVDPSTCTLDPNRLEETVRALKRVSTLGKPTAVVPVHLYGHPCDMEAIRRICDEQDLLLIEDCAQAHGSKVQGRRVGTWGDAGAFSFYPTKNLAAFGDGGAVCFASPDDAARCRALREYGWRERYVSEFPGLNSRLDEIQAAILSVRLRHLEEEIAKRRDIARLYERRLSECLELPVTRAGCEHSFHLYVARTPARQELQERLASLGIATGIHYPVPVHRQPAYLERVAIGHGGLQVTEALAREVVSLPMHPFLTPDELDFVAASVEAWAEEGGRR